MQQRRFGSRGPMVGAIGFGAMSFGGFYGATTEAESHATLARALELGVTHWDTANVYGPETSERVIGSFLRADPGARRRIHLATKGGIHRDPAAGKRSFDNSREHLTAALDASLKRLGLDHVDLYYVHRREAARPIEEVMETLLGLKQAGKIGGIGFSEIAPASLRRAAAVGPVDAVQSEYSLWTRGPELGLVRACKEVGAALVAFSPLGRAILTGTLAPATVFGDNDFRRANPRFVAPNYAANLREIDKLVAFARARGLTPGQVALAWLLAQDQHIIPIPGTRSPIHLAENAAAAGVALTSADMAELDSCLPAGFAHGDRYNEVQSIGPERYG
ncbi:MAG: aldo/keto reductase [Hyphomicrobiales bacterium]|nr:aldo/keto reductase [Hyphomicrobiales bacterium]